MESEKIEYPDGVFGRYLVGQIRMIIDGYRMIGADANPENVIAVDYEQKDASCDTVDPETGETVVRVAIRIFLMGSDKNPLEIEGCYKESSLSFMFSEETAEVIQGEWPRMRYKYLKANGGLRRMSLCMTDMRRSEISSGGATTRWEFDE